MNRTLSRTLPALGGALLLACNGGVSVAPGTGGGGAASSSSSSGSSSSTSASSSSSSSSGAPMVCTPGATQPCTCADGGSGKATCDASGSGFGECTACVPDLPWSAAFGCVGTVHINADDSVIAGVHPNGLDHPPVPLRILGFDPSGAIVLDRSADVQASVRPSSDGTLLVAGQVGGPFSSHDVFGIDVPCADGCGFVARLDATGTPIWVRTYPGVVIVNLADGEASDGRFAVQLLDTAAQWSTASMSPSGDILWSRPGLGTVAVTAGGDVLVGGWLMEPLDFGAGPLVPLTDVANGHADSFLARLDGNGDVLFQRQFAATPDTSVQNLIIAAEPSGDALLLGGWGGLYDLGDGPTGGGMLELTLARINAAGDVVYHRVITMAGPSSSFWALAAGPGGEPWASVPISSGFTFAGQPLPGAGTDSFAVMRFDAAGLPISARTFGGGFTANCYGMSVSAENVPVCVGGLGDGIDFGQGLVTPVVAQDSYIAKLGP